MNTIDTLDNLRIFFNSDWYLKWLTPKIHFLLPSLDFLAEKDFLKSCRFFGAASSFLNIGLTANSLKNDLQKKEYIDLDGNVNTRRRLDKAFFNLSALAVTGAFALTYFALKEATTSFFLGIAMSAIGFAKSLYSLSKNLYKYYKFKKTSAKKEKACRLNKAKISQNPYSLVSKKRFAAKKKYLKSKIKKSTFDVVGTGILLFCSAIWLAHPVTAVVGLLAIGLCYAYMRKKYFKKTSKKLKAECRNLAKESQFNPTASGS